MNPLGAWCAAEWPPTRPASLSGFATLFLVVYTGWVRLSKVWERVGVLGESAGDRWPEPARHRPAPINLAHCCRQSHIRYVIAYAMRGHNHSLRFAPPTAPLPGHFFDISLTWHPPLPARGGTAQIHIYIYDIGSRLHTPDNGKTCQKLLENLPIHFLYLTWSWNDPTMIMDLLRSWTVYVN